MTAREFLKVYTYSPDLVTGAYYSQEPVAVEPGDRVGVLLLNLGGPTCLEDVEPFLYNLFMDPAIIDIPIPKWLRHPLCRFIASKRAASVAEDYRQIGGGSPINKLTQEQAAALEQRLNGQYADATGATFKTYIAMRYWRPFSETAARQMAQDGVNKVVILPLYPHYSKTTTGSSLVYWKALEDAGAIPAWPTSLVYEYASHPKYVQALSDRIDEALQRFPRHVRDRVHLVFSAHGTPVVEMKKRRDPYCCLVHSTVQQVVDLRAAHGDNRPFDVAFQSKVGPAEWLTPGTPDKLKDLAEAGTDAVLVIPVAFVTDHIETAFELDIEVREEAHGFGIEHYEVTSGLNCHPLFIDALAEAVAAQVQPAVGGGDGTARRLPTPIPTLPRYPAACRSVRCHQCERITEAHDWTQQPQAPAGVAAAA